MNNSEQHQLHYLKDKEAQLRSKMEKESVLKQRTLINKEINEVNEE